VDLVVGAKGSPLQLILSTVLHVDIPTGNIPFAAAKSIAADPMVRSATPLSLGDTYRGARIVGTDAPSSSCTASRCAGQARSTRKWKPSSARKWRRSAGFAVGAQFAGSHGLAAAGTAHGDHPIASSASSRPRGRSSTGSSSRRSKACGKSTGATARSRRRRAK
jgi:putative ABC transport system permease protein